MNKVFLSIGSNLGCREQNLSKGILMIKDMQGTIVNLESSIYKTSPLYNPNQQYFFNKVVQITTKLNPHELLENTKSIELIMGKNTESSHNLPRIIDIDILVFNDINIDNKELTLPHPRLLDRRFVLEPWKEIAPNYIINGQDLSIEELYNKYLENEFKNQKVEKINN